MPGSLSAESQPIDCFSIAIKLPVFEGGSSMRSHVALVLRTFHERSFQRFLIDTSGAELFFVQPEPHHARY